MGLFNQFPFTNFHEMNLDWIINTITEIKSEIKNIPEEIDKYLNSDEFQTKLKTWVYEYLNNSGSPVPLKLFGAKGDGVTDDSAAFEIAYKLATKMTNWNTTNPWQNHTNSSLYLGNGRFRLTINNPLAISINESGGSSVWGVKIYGDGPFASQLFYSPISDNTELHFFYNQINDVAGMIGASFENMGFLIDESSDGNFFNVNSVPNNTTQGWFFTNCNIIGNKTCTLIKTNGNLNDSEFTFTNCRIREIKHAVDTSEGSYENLHFIFNSSHIEHVFSDCFITGGGSGIFVSDCSLLFDNASEAQCSIINMVNKSVSGGEYSFTNLRAEFHNDSIIYKESAYSQAIISFRNCRLGVSYTASSKIKLPKESGNIITFYDCYLDGAPYGNNSETPFIYVYSDNSYSGNLGCLSMYNCIYDGNMPITNFSAFNYGDGTPININNMIYKNTGKISNGIIQTAARKYTTIDSLKVGPSDVSHIIKNNCEYYSVILFGSDLPDTISLSSDAVSITAINSDTSCRIYKFPGSVNNLYPLVFTKPNTPASISSGLVIFTEKPNI